ncbi:hypothetical protein GCM10027088_27160 [Nocardia goodfellowii]
MWVSDGPDGWAGRLFRLRTTVRFTLQHLRRPRGYTGKGQWVPSREYGGWAIRPCWGWRRIRWVTPPVHWTHAIPADDNDAVGDWMQQKLGM